MATPRTGAEHRELMLDAARTAMFGVMVSDSSRGRVFSCDGRPFIRYDLRGVPTLRDGDSRRLRARRRPGRAGHPGSSSRRRKRRPERTRGQSQITIMPLATRLAFALLGRSAPEREAHPERIA